MTRHRPLQPGEQQRYLRRRANRRVRTTRLKRSVLRGALVLAANALVGGVLLYAGTAVVTRVAGSAEFLVTEVSVEGIRRGDAEGLRTSLEALRGQNLIELDLRAVETLVERDPWIRDAAVRRVLPDTLHVAVVEREPAALLRMDDTLYLIDRRSHVIGPLAEGADVRLPLLTGLDRSDRDALAAAIARGVDLIARLTATAPELAADLVELDLSERDRVIVHTTGNDPLLYLDPRHAERNVAEYLALRAVLRERAGSMDYVDLRWDGRIAVKPTNDTKETR